VALLVTALAAPAAAEPDPRASSRPIVIVVSERWEDLEAIEVPVLGQLWLGRRTRLAGRRVDCIDLPAGSPVRGGFARSVLRRSERELERHWIEQALSGGPPPPREVASAAEVVRRVAARRGAIGYLDWDEYRALRPQGVRVLPVWIAGETVFPTEGAYPVRWSERNSATAPNTRSSSLR
jgi:hypothetical protein